MIKWQFKELQDGEVAKFSVCGIVAWVRDCDGDFSIWGVRQGRKVLAEGPTCPVYDPYHFDLALGAAEAALRAIVASRKAALLGKRALTRLDQT